MKKEEFCSEMEEKLMKIHVKNSSNVVGKFYDYMNLLLEWNEKINLTAITNPNDIILKHYIDSLSITKYIKDNSKIVDVGTGAGFPGIPLKIINATYDITLVDALNKRINFLNNVIEKIDLKKIETKHARAEEFAKDLARREKYDVAVSRAVAQLNVLLEYLLPLVKVGGICICMKGSNVDEEVNNSKKALEILGGKIEKIDRFNLLESDNTRNIIVIRKIKETPKKYPRKAGTPSKEPL